jgi:hypothetical protein
MDPILARHRDVRTRIEAVVDGGGTQVPTRPANEPVDVRAQRAEVDEFVTPARKGAYMDGDRRVSPRERTRWRFTFKRLAAQAVETLRGEDHRSAAAILEKVIDLVGETRDYEYFRSEDPMEAAGFVVSEAVGVLWTTILERDDFEAFANTRHRN